MTGSFLEATFLVGIGRVQQKGSLAMTDKIRRKTEAAYNPNGQKKKKILCSKRWDGELGNGNEKNERQIYDVLKHTAGRRNICTA